MKIAAVIVTFNRLNLLKECIEAIRNQTKKVDEIVVINNSSTDGTLEWLLEQNDLTIITQENSGSAGGQYIGIKYAYEKGYDWIWCMDDDGRPSIDCLEILCNHTEQNDKILNPLVLALDNNTFSFGCWVGIGKNAELIKTYKEFCNKKYNHKDIIESFGTPFNGTLIPRRAITDAGYPKKELFIWGDESEYVKRIYSKGYKSFIVTKAKFFHPHNPLIYDELSFPKKDWWKLYYKYRNYRIVLYYENKNKLIANLKYLKRNVLVIIKVIFSTSENKIYKSKLLFFATLHSFLGKFGKFNIN